jgi:hypothetical protein
MAHNPVAYVVEPGERLRAAETRAEYGGPACQSSVQRESDINHKPQAEFTD